MRHLTIPLVVAFSSLPLGAQTTPATAPPAVVTLFGEVRTRTEWDRPFVPAAADAFTYLRSRIGVMVDAGHRARILLQAQDSRVLGAQASSSAATDVFDIHQAFLELGQASKSRAFAARVGRQEVALGNERLMGAVAWSNTGRTFDGVRLLLTSPSRKPGIERWSATAFAATVEERGRHFGAPVGAATTDQTVVGLFASRSAANGILDATIIRDVGAKYRSFADAHRTTLDLRLRTHTTVGIEVEGAMQGGRQHVLTAASGLSRPQEVRAWLAGARVGSAPRVDSRRTLRAGVDIVSGDATPSDSRYGAFNTLFATNHPLYGLMDVIGDPAASTKERGLVDAFLGGSAGLTRDVALQGQLHRFGLAAGSDRALGWELDFVAPIRVNPAASAELGYSLFRAGAGASAVALGAEGNVRHWAYLQLRVVF